jgi:DNA-directed RNA polymerase beta' subunit
MERYHKQARTSFYPTGITFSVYTADEIKKLSVKKIITGMTFDKLGHPLPGGLYDPALGKIFYSYYYNDFTIFLNNI